MSVYVYPGSAIAPLVTRCSLLIRSLPIGLLATPLPLWYPFEVHVGKGVPLRYVSRWCRTQYDPVDTAHDDPAVLTAWLDVLESVALHAPLVTCVEAPTAIEADPPTRTWATTAVPAIV